MYFVIHRTHLILLICFFDSFFRYCVYIGMCNICNFFSFLLLLYVRPFLTAASTRQHKSLLLLCISSNSTVIIIQQNSSGPCIKHTFAHVLTLSEVSSSGNYAPGPFAVIDLPTYRIPDRTLPGQVKLSGLIRD